MIPQLLRLGTNCFVIRLPPRSWFYSYETLVAYSNVVTGERWRHPGPMTPATVGHMQTLGVDSYPCAESIAAFWVLAEEKTL